MHSCRALDELIVGTLGTGWGFLRVVEVVFAMSTSYTLVPLIVLLMLVYLVVKLWLTRGRQLARRPCWDGGLRQLLPDMTYTATGFSNPVRVIFDAIFRPTTVGDTRETVAEHFRTAIRGTRKEVHVVDRFFFGPLVAIMERIAQFFATAHHGRINAYVAYILIALVAFLLIGRFM